MAQRLNNINRIISTLKSGADFYRKASRTSGKPEHAGVFIEHAELRETVARELAAVIEGVGGEVKEADLKEDAMKNATRIGAIFADTEKTLVAGLEEHEDRTLAVFREAIHHPDNAGDEAALSDYMHKFQESHDRMKALKDSLKGSSVSESSESA